MPRVYNKHHGDAPKNAVYIGRGSFMGNPFKIGEDGDRVQVIDRYIDYVESKPELKKMIIQFCKGKNLVCFCKPLPCHGDYILKICEENK